MGRGGREGMRGKGKEEKIKLTGKKKKKNSMPSEKW